MLEIVGWILSISFAFILGYAIGRRWHVIDIAQFDAQARVIAELTKELETQNGR